MSPLTDDTYRAAEKRRDKLLNQWYRGFTEEEIGRRFDEHPGWLLEFGRRSQANLNVEEWAELEQLQEAIEEHIANEESRSKNEIKRADQLINRALDRVREDKDKKNRADPLKVEVEWFLAGISAVAVFLILLIRLRHLFVE